MKNLLIIVACLASLAVMGQKQFQNESAGTLGYFSGQIVQLAEATPEATYSWRPAEGVRSFKEVCYHIISGNYMFAGKLGATMPAGLDMATLEASLDTKAKLIEALKSSNALVSGAIQSTADADLPTKVEFPFPGEYTKMSAAIIALNHSSEHLGQLIAYARVNGITPPWSKAGTE